MVEAAVRLLATRGLEGTSFADVLTATGAPRGSVYHHFPGGKSELVHAALDLASRHALGVLEASRGSAPEEVVARFLGLWSELLDRANLSAGCAILAVSVAADDKALRDHAGDIFRLWTGHLAALLGEGGMSPADAERLAVMLVTTTEGAVAMCRAQQSREPFDMVAPMLVALAKP